MESSKPRFSIFNLPSSIPYLLRVPPRIALGDGNEDDRNDGNDEPDGGDPAAHAVEIKKIEQRAEGLRARTLEKQGRAELAHKNRHQDDPACHNTGAHHGN